MKISGGKTEDETVVGNTYDKYGSRNPIVLRIMNGFSDALAEFVAKSEVRSIHEIGCGEGYWVQIWHKEGYDVRGSDFSSVVIDLARENATEAGCPPTIFEQRSIYEVDPAEDSAELIVCCEVLEHLEDPEKALSSLQLVVQKHLIISVPHEPIWRVLNMARGKYLSDWGNTPGHIQHWSRSGITELVAKYFDIEEVKTPFPWTMIFCSTKGGGEVSA